MQFFMSLGVSQGSESESDIHFGRQSIISIAVKVTVNFSSPCRSASRRHCRAPVVLLLVSKAICGNNNGSGA